MGRDKRAASWSPPPGPGRRAGDDRAAARRAAAQPGADPGGHAGAGARRPVRQHRPRLQLAAGDRRGAEASPTTWSPRPASAPIWARRSSSTSSAGVGGLEPAAAVVVATVRALKMHGGVAKTDLGEEDVGGRRMRAFRTCAATSRTCASSACRWWWRSTPSPATRRPRSPSIEDAPRRVGVEVRTLLATSPRAARARWAWPKRSSRWPTSGAARFAPLYPDEPAAGRQDPPHRHRDLPGPRRRVLRSKRRRSWPSTRPPASARRRSAWPRPSTASPPTPTCSARPRATCCRCATCASPPAPASWSRSAGEIMTMPGLPRHPASERIRVDADGEIVGLA